MEIQLKERGGRDEIRGGRNRMMKGKDGETEMDRREKDMKESETDIPAIIETSIIIPALKN